MLKAFAILAYSCLAVTSPATGGIYPNEIKGLTLYEKFLAPLRPLESDRKEVEQVLGLGGILESKDWTIRALYSCTADPLTCTHSQRNDPLETIEVVPKHSISLHNVKFSSEFAHSWVTVSEINVTCDVYSDKYGLEYWVVSAQSGSHRKGDLWMIKYGPAPSTE